MSSGESQQAKHQRKGDSCHSTHPLHSSDAPHTAVHLQGSRTAGFGVPVAQLPVKTISVDGKRKGELLGVGPNQMARSLQFSPSCSRPAGSKDMRSNTMAGTPCFGMSSCFSHLHHQENRDT